MKETTRLIVATKSTTTVAYIAACALSTKATEPRSFPATEPTLE